MQVKLASPRGFCFGVEDAIESAQDAVQARGAGKVVALGPVVHNREVVGRLEEEGLDQSGALESVDPSKSLLIRSHGATPETYERAAEQGLEIVDATCVLVKKAQDAVKKLHEDGYHVVLIGDAEHPEVKGVVGYAPQVTVIDHESDLDEALPYFERLGIVGQTTHAPAYIADVVSKILQRPFREVKIVNTLCLEVVRRQEAAVALAREVEVMFVLGGRHSANTSELARLCAETGCPTHHLETWADFALEMVAGKAVAGVTAGASTPEWVVSEFVQRLQTI